VCIPLGLRVDDNDAGGAEINRIGFSPLKKETETSGASKIRKKRVGAGVRGVVGCVQQKNKRPCLGGWEIPNQPGSLCYVVLAAG